MTYSSVVSRESIHIAFLLAALNKVDIMVTDIGNVYLYAPTDFFYIKTGPEFR